MKRLALFLFLVPLCFYGQITVSPSAGGISNPNTANVIFSDPTKTLLLGDAAKFSDLSSTISGGTSQLLIQSHDSDPGLAFAVVGKYRNGVSGERYFMGIGADGHYTTNSYVSLDGLAYNIPGGLDYMFHIGMDVARAILIGGQYTDAAGGRFFMGFGAADGGGTNVKTVEIGTQGTLYLYNPYGQTGSVQYAKPQAVFADIGTNYAAPSWTYGSLRESAGHLRIGTYNGSTTEGDEIDITAGAVKVNGTLEVTGHDKFEGVTSTGATGTGKLVFDTTPTFQAAGNAVTMNGSNPGWYMDDGSGHIGAFAVDSAGAYWDSASGAGDIVFKSYSGQVLLVGTVGGTAKLALSYGDAFFSCDAVPNSNAGYSLGSSSRNWLGLWLNGAAGGNATTGTVGEYVSSLVAIGSPQSLSNGTAANVTSISLTAGDWDVEGNVNFTETTSTVTARTAGISSTSATLPTDGSEAYCGVQSTVTSETNSIPLPRKRISIASTTTVYLVAKATFSAGTCGGFGAITARRVR
jgi:hypothetical protein